MAEAVFKLSAIGDHKLDRDAGGQPIHAWCDYEGSGAPAAVTHFLRSTVCERKATK